MEEWLDYSDVIDRIEEFLEMGLFDEALAVLDNYESAYGDQWEFPYLYSRVFMNKNEPRAAIPYLHRSYRLNHADVDVLLGLFYAYAESGRIKRGNRFLSDALKRYPDNEEVLSARIWYCAEVGDFSSSSIFIDKALRLPPENSETYRNIATVYQRLGNYDEAGECFERAVELNPQSGEDRDLLADHYIITGEMSKCISLYKKYLKESPRNIRALSRLTSCLTQAEQLDDAEASAKRTIFYYPNSTAGHIDLAYVYLAAGKFDEALTFAAKALSLSPLEAEAFRVRAIALSEKGLDGAAREVFTAALSLEPDNTEIMRDFYHHFRATGDFDSMIEMVSRVIHMEAPYCIEDYWFLADFYQEQGDLLKALGFLRKAYKSMPGEKDLLPPIISILLDNNHTGYTAGFFLKYVGRAGWDAAMNDFARHRRLRGRLEQEALRFLRFCANEGNTFHDYIFRLYLRRALILAILTAGTFCTALSFFRWGWGGMATGLGLTAAACAAIRYLTARSLRAIENNPA